ncbi:MAG: pyridoxal phosphate-dependent aminotransferase [Sphingobacteriia bacterium]|nr:pyridoxal phosphate-dependent aminotransferase [Sphingobacteriia bacterium]
MESVSWISRMSNLVKSRGGINLAQGIPGFDPPVELIQFLTSPMPSYRHQYAQGAGHPVLLERIASLIDLQSASQESSLLVLNGATEAISLVYLHEASRFGKEFTTMSIEPSYESYSHLPMVFGHRYIGFEQDPDGDLDLNAIEKTICEEKVNLFMLASPGNPYGRIYSESEIRGIDQICKNNNVVLLLDIVYRDIYYNQPPWHPISLLRDGLYLVGSFSKTLSVSGWRVGWLAGVEEGMKSISIMHDYTGLSVPHPLQHAIAGYLSQESRMERYLNTLRTTLKANYQYFSDELSSIGFCVSPAQGGYFIWAKLPELWPDGPTFAVDLYEKTQVAVVPGVHFYQGANRYIRFNIARGRSELEAAINKIKTYSPLPI